MRKNLSSLMTAVSLYAALALPIVSSAQEQKELKEEKTEHHHYKLVVVEPLGGPASSASGPSFQILNNRGAFAAYANTSTSNPNANCAIPFNANGGGGDCFVEHPVVWHNGKLTDLELLPGGANGQTTWISANGLIAGFSENGLADPTGLPVGRAALWTKDGKIIDLGAVPGGTESLAIAVNDQGHVVGFSNNDIPDAFSLAGLPTQTRAFLWHKGIIRDLGTLGGPDALAFVVNERGQIAGISYTDSVATPPGTCLFPLTTAPFFWENGKIVDIGSLGGTCGAANWMNDRGQVVGFSNVAGDQNNHAFVWDKKEGLKDLGTLQGVGNSSANWVNDAGEIVGNSDVPNGSHAVLWKNGVMIDLGLLPGDCNSEALAINSKGQIVGHSSPDCVQDGNAVLWENGDTPINLNSLVPPGTDVTVVFPLDINDRGEIAAHAFTPTGDQRAVLLIPCDENHPHVEGCDYDDVEAVTDASVRSAQITRAPAAATAAKLSPAERTARFRSVMARHDRRFGARPPK